MQKKTWLGMVAMVLAVASELAFASAVVDSFTGTIQAIPGAGAGRTLRVGDRVNQGETVSTGASSSAVLRFDDGQVVALTANSRLAVSTYSYNKAKPAESNMVLSLAQGGMRAITGLIGKSKPSNVTYRAGNATIGIRGTDVEFGADSGDVYAIVISGEVDYFPPSGTASLAGNPVGMNLAMDGNVIQLAQTVTPRRLGAGQGLFQRGNNPPTTGPAGQIRSTVQNSNPALNNAQQQQQSNAQQNAVNQSQQNSQQQQQNQQNQQNNQQNQQNPQQQSQQPTSGQSGSSGSGGSGGGTSTR